MAVAFRGNENDPILTALWDPLSRIIGEPVLTNVQGTLQTVDDSGQNLPFNEVLMGISKSLSQPMFWIGLVAAAAFVYAASEIRRRRAL
jgi:hypothetical protein